MNGDVGSLLDAGFTLKASGKICETGDKRSKVNEMKCVFAPIYWVLDRKLTQ